MNHFTDRFKNLWNVQRRRVFAEKSDCEPSDQVISIGRFGTRQKDSAKLERKQQIFCQKGTRVLNCTFWSLKKYSYSNLTNLTGHPVPSPNRGLRPLRALTPSLPSPEVSNNLSFRGFTKSSKMTKMTCPFMSNSLIYNNKG